MSKSSRQKIFAVTDEETWQTARQLAERANVALPEAQRVLYNLSRGDKVDCRTRIKQAPQWLRVKGATLDVQRYTHNAGEKFDVTASVDLAHCLGY